jgi:hypothetical protein
MGSVTYVEGEVGQAVPMRHRSACVPAGFQKSVRAAGLGDWCAWLAGVIVRPGRQEVDLFPSHWASARR